MFIIIIIMLFVIANVIYIILNNFIPRNYSTYLPNSINKLWRGYYESHKIRAGTIPDRALLFNNLVAQLWQGLDVK